MTGLIGEGGEGGGLLKELTSFNAKLGKVPALRRSGLLGLKACAWGGYRYGRWRSVRSRRSDESCGAVRVTANSMPERLSPSPADGEVLVVVIAALARTNAERRSLSDCVAAVSRQSRPPEALIVVDDGAVRPLTGLDTQLPHRLLRHTANTGPAAARNTGLDAAAAAGASLVAFTDADCAPASTWLEAFVSEQQVAARRGVVCGRTEADGAKAEALAAAIAAGLPPPPPPPKPSLIDEFHDRAGTLNGRVLPDGSLLYGCTCNLSLALRPTPGRPARGSNGNGGGEGAAAAAAAAAAAPSTSTAAAAVPPLHFDPEFREAAFEDVDFSVRARELGIPLSYCERALVHHDFSSRSAALGLFRQFERYGFWEPMMTAKHPQYHAWFGSSTAIPSSVAAEEAEEAAKEAAAAAEKAAGAAAAAAGGGGGDIAAVQ